MISSASNQQIKRIRGLLTKAKIRSEEGLFIVEGRRMTEEVPAELLERVYCSESFAAEEKNRDLMQRFDPEIVADSVFRSTADTMTPQGILAIVRQKRYALEDLTREKKPILILESVQDPGNLGTMMRTGEGAGIGGIIMNRETVDLFNPKTVRATMGSMYRVPFLVAGDLERTISELKGEGYSVYAAHLKGTGSYAAEDYTKPSAFLIGNEGNGLTDETADLADRYIRIPMEGQLESLNAAVAAALLMYEAHRQRHTER